MVNIEEKLATPFQLWNTQKHPEQMKKRNDRWTKVMWKQMPNEKPSINVSPNTIHNVKHEAPHCKQNKSCPFTWLVESKGYKNEDATPTFAMKDDSVRKVECNPAHNLK